MSNDIGPWMFALGGALASMMSILLWLRVLRIALGFMGLSAGEPSAQTSRRRLWLLPLLVFHPGFWILSILVYLTIKAASGGLALNWVWFLGGFYFGVLTFSLFMSVAVLRNRRAKARAGT